MKYMSQLFSIFTVTVLFVLITFINSPMQFFSQNLVLATTQEEQGDSSSSSNENEESTGENEASETLQGSTDSEETEENNSDLTSSSDQNNECPDASDLSNVPTFIGENGCQYPCPSPDNVEQDSIFQGCPIEPAQQLSSDFNINEERPIQSEQQESTTLPPQQDIQTTTPSQNTFTNPGVSSDTTTDTTNNIPNTGPTFTQKLGNPAGQFKSGSDLTGLDIPKSFYNPSGPFNPGTGNPQREGITSQENTNPATPVDPGNIPSKIEDRLAYLTVLIKPNLTEPFEMCVLISQPYEVQGNPYCVQTSGGESTIHALQAPGLIDIKALTSKYDVNTSNCEFRIYPQQSKSCFLDVTVNPVIKSKSETTKQDTTLSFNR